MVHSQLRISKCLQISSNLLSRSYSSLLLVNITATETWTLVRTLIIVERQRCQQGCRDRSGSRTTCTSGSGRTSAMTNRSARPSSDSSVAVRCATSVTCSRGARWPRCARPSTMPTTETARRSARSPTASNDRRYKLRAGRHRRRGGGRLDGARTRSRRCSARHGPR